MHWASKIDKVSYKFMPSLCWSYTSNLIFILLQNYTVPNRTSITWNPLFCVTCTCSSHGYSTPTRLQNHTTVTLPTLHVVPRTHTDHPDLVPRQLSPWTPPCFQQASNDISSYIAMWKMWGLFTEFLLYFTFGSRTLLFINLNQWECETQSNLNSRFYGLEERSKAARCDFPLHKHQTSSLPTSGWQLSGSAFWHSSTYLARYLPSTSM